MLKKYFILTYILLVFISHSKHKNVASYFSRLPTVCCQRSTFPFISMKYIYGTFNLERFSILVSNKDRSQIKSCVTNIIFHFYGLCLGAWYNEEILKKWLSEILYYFLNIFEDLLKPTYKVLPFLIVVQHFIFITYVRRIILNLLIKLFLTKIKSTLCPPLDQAQKYSYSN